MTNIASRLRHAGANNFPLQYDTDMQVSFLVVSDLTARFNIPLPMRKLKMEVKVISENKIYELSTLNRGDTQELDAVFWEEKILLNYLLSSEKGSPEGVAPLDSNGYIPPQYLGNIFVNKSYVVADQSARLALTTVTGDYIVQTDTGETWLKLNNDSPSGVEDFAKISPAGSVLSVNGQTGTVVIDFSTLLGYGNSQLQFKTALESSAFAASVNSTLGSLQNQINAIDYYTPSEIDGYLNLKADKTSIMPIDGSLIGFTPTTDYQPVNKKYVDELIESAGLGIVVLVGELYVVNNTNPQLFNTSYSKLLQYTKAGPSLGTTSSVGTGNIQVSKTGYYTITASISFATIATAPTTITSAIYVNDVITDIRAVHTFESTSETETIILRGTVQLNLGAIIDVRIKSDKPAGINVTVTNGVFTTTATVAGSAAEIKDNFGSSVAPTNNDDGTQGYSIGSQWIDVANDIVYTCTDASTGAAVWKISSASNYTHNQIAMASTWNISHNLNKYPSVSVVDSSEQLVYGDVQYSNLNTLSITFNSAFSGKAYLN